MGKQVRRLEKMKKLKGAIAVICSIVMLTTTVSAVTPWTNENGVFYNDKGEEIKGALSKGVDVSHHQGRIDWAQVKQTDIEFAIIRCGYGDDVESQDDEYFVQNVKGCQENDIPYGVYIYSYATTKEMVESEIAHVLRLLKTTEAKPEYPVYYDLEDDVQKNLSNATLADFAEMFCNEISKAGYKPGVYANKEWWSTKLTDSRFDKWDKWVAQHGSNCEYDKEYNVWQYTDKGTVNGIPGNADVNILLSRPCSIKGHTYELYTIIQKATKKKEGVANYKCKVCGNSKICTIPKIVPKKKKPGKAKITKITNQKGKKLKLVWKKTKRAEGYEIVYAKNKKFTKGKKVLNIKSASKNKIIKKLKKNQTYYVRVRAYNIQNNKKQYGTWSKSKKVVIKK